MVAVGREQKKHCKHIKLTQVLTKSNQVILITRTMNCCCWCCLYLGLKLPRFYQNCKFCILKSPMTY